MILELEKKGKRWVVINNPPLKMRKFIIQIDEKDMKSLTDEKSDELQSEIIINYAKEETPLTYAQMIEDMVMERYSEKMKREIEIVVPFEVQNDFRKRFNLTEINNMDDVMKLL